MESFSDNVKKQLLSVETKKKCCRFTASAFENYDRKTGADRLSEIVADCRCDSCRLTAARYLFIICGSVSDPEREYHLDMTFPDESTADVAAGLFEQCGFDFRHTTRRQKHVLYIKDSTAIEDFLVSLGASGAAFDIMNNKIVHEIKNDTNRMVNCDTANIAKQVDSAKKYMAAVKKLIESGEFDSLPAELKKTAELRLENDQMSIAELGMMSDPPVSKSGMRHRLEKLLELSEKEN